MLASLCGVTVALLSANGCGKSTLLNSSTSCCFAGRLTATWLRRAPVRRDRRGDDGQAHHRSATCPAAHDDDGDAVGGIGWGGGWGADLRGQAANVDPEDLEV